MRRCLIILAVSALAACGGGGGNSGSTKLEFDSVTTMGASLTDTGVYGYKVTVQPAEGEKILTWNERVAGAYDQQLCRVYGFDGSTFTNNAASNGCSNYAIAGSVIQNYQPASNTVDENSPVSIIKQLNDAGARSYDDGDLVMVGGDSGANDVAAMLQYCLLAAQGNTTYQQYFAGRVLSLVPAQLAGPVLQQGDLPTAGGMYMTALASKLATAIKANLLDKGATHVVVMNTLDVTKTPKFQRVLATLPAESAAQVSAVAQAWVGAFNNELLNQFEDEPRVTMVDFYRHFNEEVNDPPQYALSNVTDPVCDLIGKDIAQCTSTELSANPPAGVSDPNWWKSYVFANDFHPTPYGHQLLAEMVTDALAKAGWL